MKHYKLRRGTSKEFENYKDKMPSGEMVAILDRHTIAFNFGEKDIRYLNFDESVSTEKADELINVIRRFLEK